MTSLEFILIFLAALCYGARNVTIESDTGDPETHLQPTYEPLDMWSAATIEPDPGVDVNPYNISSPFTVETTALADITALDSGGLASVTLLFNGECNSIA